MYVCSEWPVVLMLSSFYAYRAKNDKNYEDTTLGSKHVLQFLGVSGGTEHD